MKIYLVGGAVRDHEFGIYPKDRDYVVVGSTPEEMISLGYSQVGAGFPVFLHPTTGEEYALARTERKTGVGYNGFETTFDPTITLEDDLRRRDLTINSMAIDLETQELIDPFGGRADLKAGILRHTSEAFAEDPVRVLRTARFAARYGFRVEPDTIELMKAIAPEIDHVPAERVWAEFEKGLMEMKPLRMVEILRETCQGSVRLEPYLASINYPALEVVESFDDLATRFGVIADGFSRANLEECKIPTAIARVAKFTNDNISMLFDAAFDLPHDKFVDLMERLRAFSDYTGFWQCINVIDLLVRYAHTRWSRNPRQLPNSWRAVIAQKMSIVNGVDTAKIASEQKEGSKIRDAIRQARVEQLTKFWPVKQ